MTDDYFDSFFSVKNCTNLNWHDEKQKCCFKKLKKIYNKITKITSRFFHYERFRAS